MGKLNAEEAFDLFWTEFDKSLVSGGKASAKGHKGDALKTYKRIVTSAKKAGEVMSGFRAKKSELMQLKKNNEFAASLPTVDRYLKKKMWEIETDSPQSNFKPASQLKQCSHRMGELVRIDSDTYCTSIIDVTHWMPMPERPL